MHSGRSRHSNESSARCGRLELALRPGRLLSFQEFRDLFSEQYLGTGVQLAVGEQTILFSDLVGSTAMYAERGDPAAFGEVKKHFDELFALISKHRGAVVKTIGDAVMGAFNEPLDAVKAARAIHDTFPQEKHPALFDCACRSTPARTSRCASTQRSITSATPSTSQRSSKQPPRHGKSR